ncbi:MAG: glycosyl hydrolase [Actinomycetota bacterium]
MAICLVIPSASSAAQPSQYWGAEIGDQLTGTQPPWDMNAVSKFEQMAGKPLSLVQFATPFANCYSSPCTFYGFPTWEMQTIRQHGAIPFFSWASQSIPSSLDQPDFQLSDVIAGTYDTYIRNWATAAKSWGRPFFLRFNFEMNGNWFQWSESANGNQPGESVAAWRHVHDIFTSVGATNATWVWCPYVDPKNTLQSLSTLYPGDAYVDWTCLDGYNWGPNANPPRVWRSFDYLFSSTYHQIVDTIAPSKPMVIGEIASTEYGGSKAGWITNMFSQLATNYPKIRGLLWFEKYADGMDWPIETSTAATNAFAKGIQNRTYSTNKFARISTSPIPPPG